MHLVPVLPYGGLSLVELGLVVEGFLGGFEAGGSKDVWVEPIALA